MGALHVNMTFPPPVPLLSVPVRAGAVHAMIVGVFVGVQVGDPGAGVAVGGGVLVAVGMGVGVLVGVAVAVGPAGVAVGPLPPTIVNVVEALTPPTTTRTMCAPFAALGIV